MRLLHAGILMSFTDYLAARRTRRGQIRDVLSGICAAPLCRHRQA